MDQETFNKIKEQAMKEVIEKFYPNAEPTQKLTIHFLGKPPCPFYSSSLYTINEAP